MNNEKEKISDGLWIYRRPNTAVWWARHKQADGWHRKSTLETDKQKAKTAAMRMMGKVEGLIESGKSPKGRKFSEASALYVQALDDLKSKGGEKPSHANYRLYVRKWIDPFFSKVRIGANGKPIPERRINSITDDVINDWEIWRMEVRQKELASKLKKKHPHDWEERFEVEREEIEPLSASSVKGIHIAVREIFDIAKRKGWVKLDQIPELNNIGVRAKPRPWFRPEEVLKLKLFMAGPWQDAPDEAFEETKQRKVHTQKTKWMRKLLRWYVLILIDSGMRPGAEIDEIRWSNVNLTYLGKDGIIYPEIKVTAGKHAAIGKTRMTYCMNSSAQHFKDIAKFSGHTKPDDFVFTMPDGTRPYRFSDPFSDLLESAGLKRDGEGNERTLYSLRHTFITMRLIADLPVQKIATHCGTSVKVIGEFYNKLEAGMSADEMLKLRPQAIEGKMTAASNLLEWM